MTSVNPHQLPTSFFTFLLTRLLRFYFSASLSINSLLVVYQYAFRPMFSFVHSVLCFCKFLIHALSTSTLIIFTLSSLPFFLFLSLTLSHIRLFNLPISFSIVSIDAAAFVSNVLVQGLFCQSSFNAPTKNVTGLIILTPHLGDTKTKGRFFTHQTLWICKSVTLG